MTRLALAALLLPACSHPGTLHGTAVDAVRGGGLPILILTPESITEACPVLTVSPRTDGSFDAAGCADRSYTVSAPEKPVRWQGLEGTVSAAAPAELKAWPTAAEPGAYVLGDTPIRLAAAVPLDAAPVLPGRTVVRYPLEVPGTVPRLRHGQHLLLQGDTTPVLTPLGRSTATLSFERPTPPTQMGAWWFEGVDLAADGTPTALPVPTPRVVSQTLDGVQVAWIDASTLPAGRYLLGTPEGARAWVLDVAAD